MLLWTLLTACTEEKNEVPISGTLEICIPEDLVPDSGDGTPIETFGTLEEIRDGTGNCSMEILVNDGETNHTVGFTILNGDGEDVTPTPSWEIGQSVSMSTHSIFVFGSSQGLILQNDDGVLLALEGGYWGGALTDVQLSFSVEWGATPIAETVSDCLTTRGFEQLLNEDSFTPFSENDVEMDDHLFNFISISASRFGPGSVCSVSDMSDQFSWALIRQ
jgi:hypothetical protein